MLRVEEPQGTEKGWAIKSFTAVSSAEDTVNIRVPVVSASRVLIQRGQNVQVPGYITVSGTGVTFGVARMGRGVRKARRARRLVDIMAVDDMVVDV